MRFKVDAQGDSRIAVLYGEEILMKDTRTALDLIMEARSVEQADKLVIFQENITKEFFDLSTCIAGDILQKFINFQTKLAIVGDFSGYTSKSLHAFIYECNRGRDIFFVSSEAEALERLHKI